VVPDEAAVPRALTPRQGYRSDTHQAELGALCEGLGGAHELGHATRTRGIVAGDNEVLLSDRQRPTSPSRLATLLHLQAGRSALVVCTSIANRSHELNK
jgi:hypothetical protein